MRKKSFLFLFLGMLLGITGVLFFTPSTGKNLRNVLIFRLRSLINSIGMLLDKTFPGKSQPGNQAKKKHKILLRKLEKKTKGLLKELIINKA